MTWSPGCLGEISPKIMEGLGPRSAQPPCLAPDAQLCIDQLLLGGGFNLCLFSPLFMDMF